MKQGSDADKTVFYSKHAMETCMTASLQALFDEKQGASFNTKMRLTF